MQQQFLNEFQFEQDDPCYVKKSMDLFFPMVECEKKNSLISPSFSFQQNQEKTIIKILGINQAIYFQNKKTEIFFWIYFTSNLYINDENIEQGNIVKIDFSSIHGRECVGEDSPSSPNSDYELWSPTGKINPDCLMGMRVEYVRRKRDAKCFNGEDLQRQHSVQYCQCTEEDWECDLNFHRENSDSNAKCIPYELYEQDFEAPQNCEDYYEVSRGYRRVAGNKCQGGVEYNPVKLQQACLVLQIFLNLCIDIGISSMLSQKSVTFGAISNPLRHFDYLPQIINFLIQHHCLEQLFIYIILIFIQITDVLLYYVQDSNFGNLEIFGILCLFVYLLPSFISSIRTNIIFLRKKIIIKNNNILQGLMVKKWQKEDLDIENSMKIQLK